MTVATTTNTTIGTGNGVSTTFPFTFGTLPTGDLVVTLYDLDGTAITQVENTDYAVLGEGADDGGAVVFTVAPPSQYTVLIQRIVPVTQPDDLKNQGSYYPRTVERMLDRRTMVEQQLTEKLARSLTLPPQVSGVSTQLPVPAGSNIIGWTGAGDALQNYAVADLATNIAYGNKSFQVFTGTGAQVDFPLSQDPGSLGNLDVAIDGVTQVNGADFTYLATTLTFTTAPANGAVILVRFDQAVPVGIALASAVNFTQTGAGAKTRDVQDRLRDTLNARDFSGVVGDGVNDDTTGLQNAITAANTLGRKLMLGPGVFLVAGLSGADNVELIGDGRGKTVIRRKASAAGNASVVDFTGKSGFAMRGITVDGNKASQTNASQACTISGCSDFVIEGCAFINAKAVSGYGVGLVVIDCATANSLSQVRGNTFSGNDLQGMLVKNALGVNIIDNLSVSNGSDGIQLADYTFPPVANAQTQVVISGNHCYANGNSGIAIAGYFTGGTLGTPIYGPNTASSFMTVTGNVCAGNEYYGIAWQGAFGSISNNICFDNGGLGFGAGILFNGLAASCVGNSCYNNEIWGIDAGGGYHNVISGNACFSNGEVGINLGATVDCVCANNQIVLTGADADAGITMPGIDGDGSTPFPTVGSGTVIEGNKIVLNGHAGTRGITVTRDYRNATVRNNVVSGGTAANQAYIFEVNRITHQNNEDTYLLEASNGHIVVVASASPLVIPDHADVVFVSGNTSITNIHTYSQNFWSGKVRDVRMSAQGSGYVVGAPPTVNFSGGGGTGAAATADVDNGGRIVGVTITNPGSGYTSAPSVSFTGGGGGSGAAGTALVGCGNANGRQIQLLFQGTLTVNDGGNLNLAGNLSATPNAATLRLLGAYDGNFYETGRTTGL